MKNKKIALFPGSFDPFTIGHQSIVDRALPMFDEIIIALGYNSNKTGFFSVEERMQWIKDIYKNEARISIEKYEGLTVDFCMQKNAQYILRGLRTAADFEYERAIAQMNKTMFPEIESVFLLTEPQYTAISSTIVRDIIRHKGDASPFLPKGMIIKF